MRLTIVSIIVEIHYGDDGLVVGGLSRKQNV